MAERVNQEQREREATLRRPATSGEQAADGRPSHPLVALGARAGNAQVARLIAQREGEEEDELQASHDLAQREGEEEDELQASHDLAQREGEEEDELQAKPEIGLEGGPLSPELSGRIDASRGAGAPIDSGTRDHMERAFDTDFADVRLHTDGEADSLNRSISARAFTTGSDIFFRGDTSPGDPKLLAHELTHVVQQQSMGGHGGQLTVGPADDQHERDADAAATAVTAGTPTHQREEEQG